MPFRILALIFTAANGHVTLRLPLFAAALTDRVMSTGVGWGLCGGFKKPTFFQLE
jgi:hypothetical protein